MKLLDKFVHIEKPENVFFLGNCGVAKFPLFYVAFNSDVQLYIAYRVMDIDHFNKINTNRKFYIEKENVDAYNESLNELLGRCNYIIEYNR